MLILVFPRFLHLIKYATSNHIPPSLQSTACFWGLQDKRELFGHIIQCHTGHGYLGDYYCTHIPSERTSCPCGDM
ncbi:hypothetical protein P691DRAFT_682495 [Macrolepiota fuliginosa MF-IS2]|uniref:Secreted protein n=1 Tax=Macrolepiota fuliginosa MF-IS2 TaxID=1400762 RepID=A0A9P6BXY8_9AGAR|nr:hypothetical protein P691DRAFT_682495 [Macrolepiota fuliginosa MF-IS2]